MPRADRGTLSFPKSARLLRRGEFVAVKQGGRGFADGPLAASWAARAVGSTPPGIGGMRARVGIAVSSKVGDAVVRNRVKRRLREAIRHELHQLPEVDLVLVARASATRASVGELRDWLRRAGLRIAADRERGR
ncbi:MAG: ribonuclease P protein component [Myxococcales bacterium]